MPRNINVPEAVEIFYGTITSNFGTYGQNLNVIKEALAYFCYWRKHSCRSNQTWSNSWRCSTQFLRVFYCLCSLQKSISKSNWFFSFLNLIFWNWKKFEWHSISQKSSGDRQGVSSSIALVYTVQWYIQQNFDLFFHQLNLKAFSFRSPAEL